MQQSNDVLSFSSSVCKIKKNDTSVTKEDLRKEIPQKEKKKTTRKERIKWAPRFWRLDAPKCSKKMC